MTTLQISRPGKAVWLREFKNRREAAKYGVAYYLRDNAYATPREATTAASAYQDSGETTHDGIAFKEIRPA